MFLPRRTLLNVTFFLGISSLSADTLVRLEEVAGGLNVPVFITHGGDGSGRLFVLEQRGRIRILEDGAIQQTFLDITDRVRFGGERGLLGLAFHPVYPDNGRFFVNYTREAAGQIQTVISEFSSAGLAADPGSERILLILNQPFANHNAGMLAFGPDGFLYVAVGDGGSGGDPEENGQDLSTLLGAILRIDVNGENPYSIPLDNPFLGEIGRRGEIWAYGFRNPWRFSFDRATRRLFVGDVGQNSYEEVDLVTRGGNYGWNRMEASQCFPPGTACQRSGLMLPIAEYGRSEGNSVTGGYVYRGLQPSDLWGRYLFGDFASGTIWALEERPGGTWTRTELLSTELRISSFGEDEQGELYVLDYPNGKVFKLHFAWRELFAHAGDGPSPVGTFQSLVVLANSGESEVSGALRFFSRFGLPQTVSVNGASGQEFPFVLAPRSSRAFLTGGTSDPFFVGWAEAVADGSFSGTLVFLLQSSEQGAVREAGITSSKPGREFVGYVSRRVSEGSSTGVAVANFSLERSVNLTLEILDESSELVASTMLLLPPGGHESLFVEQIGDLPAEFEGTVRLLADADVVTTVLRTRSGIHSASLPTAP